MQRFLVLCALGVSLSLCAPANAGDDPAPVPAKPDNKNNKKDKNAYPPPVDHSASIKARKDKAEAQAAVEKAEVGLTSTVADLKKAAESSPDWKAAQADLAKTTKDYDQAKVPVLEKLEKDSSYQAAKARKTKAEADRDKLGDNHTTPEYIQAATTVLNASSDLTKMEGQALANDPQASEARQRMMAAHDRLADLEKKFEQTLKSDPKWKSARKALDDAKVRLTAANAALPAALQTEAAAEKKRDQEVAEIDRRKAAEQAAKDARAWRGRR